MKEKHMNSPKIIKSTTPERYEYEWTRLELEEILDGVVNKTLGEVDEANVFDRTKENKKITGIAGDVIEQSVLGYPANNIQEPDLVVDGERVELKTTGLKRSKKLKGFEAKEPMSITAVSIDKIAEEEFESSSFFHKIRSMLIIYYLYDSESTVEAAGYADFLIKGYQFHEFSNEELKILKNDWQLVHDFIERIQTEYQDEEERRSLYPKLSSELRKDLMYIDTAPKFPHSPRFRLKRSVITDIARELFGDRLDQLPEKYTSYAQIDRKVEEVSTLNKGKTLAQLGYEYGVENIQAKNASEPIIVRMFGGRGKMSNIDLFSRIGLHAKSITLTKTGARTEDMKLFPLDFEELSDESLRFENSSFYSYFADNQFLFIIFEEPSHDSALENNVFIGFKRFAFNDEFIQNEVKSTWMQLRDLMLNEKLEFIEETDKKTGLPKRNKTGEIKGAPNFPKSKDGNVFLRGTGRDSSDKPICIQGIRMYRQDIWIRGSYIAECLKEIELM